LADTTLNRLTVISLVFVGSMIILTDLYCPVTKTIGNRPFDQRALFHCAPTIILN
jgi:hypothetical protein